MRSESDKLYINCYIYWWIIIIKYTQLSVKKHFKMWFKTKTFHSFFLTKSQTKTTSDLNLQTSHVYLAATQIQANSMRCWVVVTWQWIPCPHTLTVPWPLTCSSAQTFSSLCSRSVSCSLLTWWLQGEMVRTADPSLSQPQPRRLLWSEKPTARLNPQLSGHH